MHQIGLYNCTKSSQSYKWAKRSKMGIWGSRRAVPLQARTVPTLWNFRTFVLWLMPRFGLCQARPCLIFLH